MMDVQSTPPGHFLRLNGARKIRRDPLNRFLPVETAANPVSIAT